jgi:alpha-L-fucosidase
MLNRRWFIKNGMMAGALAATLPGSTKLNGQTPDDEILSEGHAEPNAFQKAWMEMKFGMFVHFGINTYYDKEWSDGTLDPIRFNPTHLDTDQWCRVAKEAGMKYIVITTKHHDGFALWPSKYSNYTVAQSPFKGDVLALLANSAHKYGLKLGFYYSIWDEHDPRFKNDWWAYMDFMRNQIEELLTGYGEIVELWMDGFWKKQRNGWVGKLEDIQGEAGFQEKNMARDLAFIQAWRNEGAYWWQMDHLYQFVKSLQPGCLVMNNSTTAYPGVPLHPVDIRSGEKYTEVTNDRKVWKWLGEHKYMPLQIETTMSIKGNEKFPTGNWFWHDWDKSVRSVSDIKNILAVASGMEANLLLNVGITDKGKLREVDETNLLALQ